MKEKRAFSMLTFGGVLGPAIFVLVTIIAATLRPDYSHIHNFISELGATGTSYASLMNYLGFVPTGLLIAGLGVGLFSIIGKSTTVRLASLLVVVFGLGIAADGIISCDVGCPQGSGSMINKIHNTIAPIAFLSMIIAAVLFGVYWRGRDGMRSFSIYSFLTAIAGLIFLSLLASTLETRVYTGLWQRLMLLVLFMWCMVIGWTIGKSETLEVRRVLDA